MPDREQVLSVRGAAEFLGLHPETIRRFCREGKIPAFKTGRHWKFRRDYLLRWTEEQAAEVRGKSVLVVDDRVAVCDVVRAALSSEGYSVQVAVTGTQALAMLETWLPDLMLLDLKLPDISGAEILREALVKNPAMPVIVITGYPDSDLLHDALSVAPLTVLAKPLRLDLLRETVAWVMRAHALAAP